MNFKEWMLEVDVMLESWSGLRSSDLADHAYWHNWQDGVTPEEMAEAVLESAGWERDDIDWQDPTAIDLPDSPFQFVGTDAEWDRAMKGTNHAK